MSEGPPSLFEPDMQANQSSKQRWVGNTIAAVFMLYLLAFFAYSEALLRFWPEVLADARYINIPAFGRVLLPIAFVFACFANTRRRLFLLSGLAGVISVVFRELPFSVAAAIASTVFALAHNAAWALGMFRVSYSSARQLTALRMAIIISALNLSAIYKLFAGAPPPAWGVSVYELVILILFCLGLYRFDFADLSAKRRDGA